jgi:hypothetical protein
MKTTSTSTPDIDISQRVYALQHLDSGEFICLLQEGTDYLACFTDGDSALEFRTLLGLQEHVDLCTTTLERSPFSHFWLDGESVDIRKESEVVN